MVSSCPNCGVVTPPEARFCRHCGTPLRTGANFEHEQISPLAQTVPLSGEGLTTSSLGTDETGRPAPETKRVRQSEIENLFRNARFDATAATDAQSDVEGSKAPDSDYAAPQTGEIVQGARRGTTAPASAPAPSAKRAASDARSRRSWILMAALLLLATLSGALLAYYFLRQRPTQSTSETIAASNSNQAAEQTVGPTAETTNVNSAAVEDEAGQTTSQPEERPTPTARPSASVEPTREARAKQERERQAEDVVPASTPTPAPSPTPVAQTQPTPASSPASTAANANNGATTKATEGSSDAFYFQAVNIVNGREPRSLKRAELLRALQLFQNVTSGAHVAEARKQAVRLSRELDRLDRQSQR